MNNTNKTTAIEVVEEIMNRDNFSRWLGIKVLQAGEGYSKIQMEIRDEMLNGLGIVHGGIPFSLADSAFAFACNSRNNLSVAWDTSITFTKPSKLWDVLTAEAKELHNGKSTGLYIVTITNQRNEQVALFKGTCFRTTKPLI
ncbi:hydroxyphenylacetyl-CoA thioesterase PaaI [Agriterribacter sp.]|uniref:hydroxyphenylacetyl-CoA thioesterase PaaI n=1 Tax=Agriterribacter sp. TaxID=2821509 RepID=UPI002CBF3EF4|nr:hydroxyphenylacetyl-CoA thioesterase PaaI [Agriterribacter sp.]HRO45358.1 hydroxyphenylacetyl-CoA thioesterase PaaI [Agriterribacter sp.]